MPTSADMSRGVKIVTVPETRWARPDVKTVSLLAPVLAKLEARVAGLQELAGGPVLDDRPALGGGGLRGGGESKEKEEKKEHEPVA